MRVRRRYCRTQPGHGSLRLHRFYVDLWIRIPSIVAAQYGSGEPIVHLRLSLQRRGGWLTLLEASDPVAPSENALGSVNCRDRFQPGCRDCRTSRDNGTRHRQLHHVFYLLHLYSLLSIDFTTGKPALLSPFRLARLSTGGDRDVCGIRDPLPGPSIHA